MIGKFGELSYDTKKTGIFVFLDTCLFPTYSFIRNTIVVVISTTSSSRRLPLLLSSDE